MAPLGRTDLEIFPICLGGNVFGWTADEPQSHAILDAYTAAGGNFIDTANSYLVKHGFAGRIYPVNPLSVARYRERHSLSRAKSDRADAKLLADLGRTDHHNQRPLPEDTEQAEAVKILARSHKQLIWSRQSSFNQLRQTLREFYPAALQAFELDSSEALVILSQAPTPLLGARLSQAKLVSGLRQAGRRQNLEARAARIQSALRTPQLEQPALVAEAHGKTVAALVGVLREVSSQIATLEAELAQSFEVHPDAEIYLSLPGLGDVLGARVLGEFGDDPNRFADAKGRRNYARTSPITRASGNRRVVAARFTGNDFLADACRWWAFAALSRSPGARRYYEQLRARGNRHEPALRNVANRLVGILHGCLRYHQPYDEARAWPPAERHVAA